MARGQRNSREEQCLGIKQSRASRQAIGQYVMTGGHSEQSVKPNQSQVTKPICAKGSLGQRAVEDKGAQGQT